MASGHAYAWPLKNWWGYHMPWPWMCGQGQNGWSCPFMPPPQVNKSMHSRNLRWHAANSSSQLYYLGASKQPAPSLLIHATFLRRDVVSSMVFLRGIVSKRWAIALSRMGMLSPINTMTEIIWLIWTKLFDPLWTTWNDILHQLVNHFTMQEHEQLGELLTWIFLRNWWDVLSSVDQFLITFQIDDIAQPNASKAYAATWIQPRRHIDLKG